MKQTKIFIGPMSKNIVDTVIKYSNEYNIKLGLIASRRQIENTGGYVNNWTTKDFCEYVRNKSKNVILVRDHAGPNQGDIFEDGIESFKEDCKPNMFDVIHVDVWKKYNDYEDGLKATIEFINLGYNINPNVCYEVGTEEAIRATTPEELNQLLSDLKKILNHDVYSKIKYAVIQSGTALSGNKNTGQFNQNRLKKMIDVVNNYSLISKEHNGDYITDELLRLKFNNGLDSINIAPEFGQIETKIILQEIKENFTELYDEFYNICLESKKWVKWVDKNFNPNKNKDELINISGHYVLSNPKFVELKCKLSKNIDDLIKLEIEKKIQNLINLSNNE
jgi:hypothetical protein